jgi:hypothetical protein
MEFQFPDLLQTEKGLQPTPRFLRGAAVYLRTLELDPGQAPSAAGHHVELLQDVMEELFPGAIAHRAGVDPADESDAVPRWIVAGQTLLAGDRRAVPVNLWAMTLDSLGRFIRHVAAPAPAYFFALMQDCSVAEAQADYAALSAGDRGGWQAAIKDEFELPFLFALALMHCRNVAVVDKPAPPAGVRKQRARKGIPFLQYKLLDVPALAAASPRGQAGGGGGAPQALHFLRGHFKDYREHGLFGKNKAIYYWHDQVRGEAAKGIIDKDYKV